MKTSTVPQLAEDYAAALRDYLAGADEAALARAYEIGRRTIDSGLSLFDIATIHHEAMTAALERAAPEAIGGSMKSAMTFFAESLAAFEMAQRGYRAATVKLLALKEELEQSAAKLAAVNDELRSENAERRRAEEAAGRAKDEAERASRAKSEFLSRVSHELRTPFNAVLGFAQLLEMDDLNPDQRESVGHIIKAGRHLLDLINEVLDISRIESETLSLSVEPVPVREVAQETVDLVRGIATRRGIELRADLADGADGHAMADRQRLKQVLLNLLSNAVKYNREEGVVTVAFGEAHGTVRIEVTDTGPGIPPDRIDRLFNPFERMGAEQGEIEGTGLGLALSKRLVEAMGGTISLEATSDRGTTFFIQLPRAEPPVSAHELAEKPSPPPRPSGRTRTVLYIEDNLSNLTLVERVLVHRPAVEVISALQGRLGLELAQQHRPDLILLDLNLPDVPGQEILRKLKESPQTSGIPVVVITADVARGQVESLIAAGAHDHITKPLDVQRFLAMVDEVLAGAERFADGAQPT
ncbi:MAG: ATP-binding protein [Actinomycetota bacterium]